MSSLISEIVWKKKSLKTLSKIWFTMLDAWTNKIHEKNVKISAVHRNKQEAFGEPIWTKKWSFSGCGHSLCLSLLSCFASNKAVDGNMALWKIIKWQSFWMILRNSRMKFLNFWFSKAKNKHQD